MIKKKYNNILVSNKENILIYNDKSINRKKDITLFQSDKILKEKNNTQSNNFIFFSFLTILLIIILGFVFSIPSISSQTPVSSPNQVSYCCEKTIGGAYCQNAPLNQCDSNFRSTPTSCEATSYCKKGCCYDSNEGICMESTPLEACKSSNGVWSDNPTCKTPQCDLGCCVLGQQAAYVPLVRCKKLAGLYGLQVDFRQDVKDELSCINLAQAQDIGACVYEADFVTTCKFTTRGECEAGKLKSITNSTQIRFHKDYLCTAPEFGTDCQPLDVTSCVDGKDGVYFKDSCGNTANIYDSTKIWAKTKSNPDTIEYWTKVKKKEESCGANGGNPNSKNCGNCDYFSGSVCSLAENNKPAYGNYICQDVNCYNTLNGKSYKNGESWCFYDDKKPETDSVGSRHYRHICVMGEEMIEPCDDFRQKVCVEGSINLNGGNENLGGSKSKFSQAGCVVNRWQDCVLQNKTGDCLNSDKRDCEWISLDPKDIKNGLAGITGLVKKTDSNTLSRIEFFSGGGSGSLKSNLDNDKNIGRCVPKIDPGLMFWDQSAGEQCKIATENCIVKYEKGILDKEWKCVENCQCLTNEMKYVENKICSSLGDCGAGINYIGKFTNEGYEIIISKGKETKQPAGGVDKTNGASQISSPSPPSGNQTFGGSGGQPTFRGSQPAGTGNVIQGLIVKSYNKFIVQNGEK